jgi:hypothetical protein
MILDVSIHLLVQEELPRGNFEERGDKFLAVVSAITSSTTIKNTTEGYASASTHGPGRVPGWLDDEWDEDPGERQHGKQAEQAKPAGLATPAAPEGWTISVTLELTNPSEESEGSEPGVSKGKQPASKGERPVSRGKAALSRMLRLRSLFYLAFLLLGPDSSDVYETMGEHAEISMV